MLSQDKTVCSASGVYCARMDVDQNETVIVTGEQALWTMKGWFRDAHLANDGEHLVAGYDGLVLLQEDYRADTTMITFWDRGHLIRAVPLSEVIIDDADLIPTVSHYLWGRSEGFDADGRFVVHTIENRRIAFDVKTGHSITSWFATYPR